MFSDQSAHIGRRRSIATLTLWNRSQRYVSSWHSALRTLP